MASEVSTSRTRRSKGELDGLGVVERPLRPALGLSVGVEAGRKRGMWVLGRATNGAVAAHDQPPSELRSHPGDAALTEVEQVPAQIEYGTPRAVVIGRGRREHGRQPDQLLVGVRHGP